MDVVIIILGIASGLGFALSLWGEIAEQRRLSQMARDCKQGRPDHE